MCRKIITLPDGTILFNVRTGNGSIPTDGAGSSRSRSGSPPAPGLHSVTFIGLPDSWITLLADASATLRVRRQGQLAVASIFMGSFYSPPFRMIVEDGPSTMLFVPLHGDGGTKSTEDAPSPPSEIN